MEEYFLMGQVLFFIGLGWVLFRIEELFKKPPLLIKCECFKDQSHDDMVKVKEMYNTLKAQAEEKAKQEEEVDNLNKED